MSPEQYEAAYREYLAAHRVWEKQRDVVQQQQQQLEVWLRRRGEYIALKDRYENQLLPAYTIELDEWRTLNAAYQAAEREWSEYWRLHQAVSDARDSIAAGYDRMRESIAARWGWSGRLPTQSCTNATDKAHAQAMCEQTTSETHVAGLGGEVQYEGTYYGTDSAGVLWCALAELPLCAAMPPWPTQPAPAPPFPGPEPTPPSSPTPPGPAPVVPALGPEPEAPLADFTTLPQCAPADVVRRARLICDGAPNDLANPFAGDPCATAQLPACDSSRASMVVGGIALLLALGGGYAVWRTFRKKSS